MEFSMLPENITNNIDFKTIFDLRPKDTNTVNVFNKNSGEYEEKTIFRNYMCYLNTPIFDSTTKKSYMFTHKSDLIPTEFEQFIAFAKSVDIRYNQMVVNWYDPNDYIELHRDCMSKMVDTDCEIMLININESDDVYKLRYLINESVEDGKITSVPLLNKYYYIINNNLTHRHGVGKGVEKRMSLTFRMIK